jgi:N-dimethylarginine dimethylaminohydrolase
MVDPAAFRVAYAINCHMRDPCGALNEVDPVAATRQWHQLRRTYESMGYPVAVLAADPDLPDQVFAANPVFVGPGANGSGLFVLPSRMRHRERDGEVAPILEWLERQGARVAGPAPSEPCEGHGDLLWHPSRRLILAGHGPRTAPGALGAVALAAETPITAFQLVDPRWYHLDTALVPIDAGRAACVQEAFDAQGLELLAAIFPRLVPIPAVEAAGALAGNAHCPDGRNVIIDAAAQETARILAREDLRVHPVDTSEFCKSGGSVFCLKLMLWPS